MNPSNIPQQPLTAGQYYIATGMPPLSPATSILKSNIPAVSSVAVQQQPTIITTLNSVSSSGKAPATSNNNLIDTKFVTSATNYMPVLLNQTFIEPIQAQHPTKIAAQGLFAHTPVVTGTSSSNTNIPLIMANSCNKPMVLSTSNNPAGNITYQVLSTSQNNNLTPVITAPNGTVSVLLTSSQPMATAGHVAAPIIIRNTPAATTTKPVQKKQQQFAAKQQQQLQQTAKLHTFNPQSFNPEILKQIVVGNPSSGAPGTLAPGTTLLKPTILQNKQITQQQQQQQIENKTLVKNQNMMIATSQQQQHYQLQQKLNNNHTIITTTTDNSSQMLATLGMELVKAPPVIETVQKLSQVSLLQNPTKKSISITEIIDEPVTVLKNTHEIKVGNLNSEVSLIKKPNLSATEFKSKEISLLKPSKKMPAENVEKNTQQELEKSTKVNTVKINNKEKLVEKETNESYSLLRSNQDLKKDASEEVNSNIKSSITNVSIEKQKSLLKPKTFNKKSREQSSTPTETPQLTSPRSHRSNSCNTQLKATTNASANNNERRHSEPANIDLEPKSNTQETSPELDIFFEDEEYLESSGDKSSDDSEKCPVKDNKSPSLTKKQKENDKTKIDATNLKETETKNLKGSQETENEKNNKQLAAESIKANNENKTSQDFNNEGSSSEDDDVTILPTEEVEIEQIEIDDDDDDSENILKEMPQTNLRSPSQDKEQLNESLLCDEQFLVSSSSSISNNSLDQNSTTVSQIKSPTIDKTNTPLLKKTLMEPKSLSPKDEPQSNGYSSALDMLSNFNMLNWRERIGTARGTSLKFQLNEFNLIQLYEKSMPNKRIHTAYEKPIYERESSHKRNENRDPPTYYMCRRCNVQGPSVDFLAPEFCSLSCLKRDCRKRRDDTTSLIRKRNRLNNINNNNNAKTLFKNTSFINDTTSINNPPPLTYIRKPKFRWNTYMDRNYNVIAAPISLFLNPFPTGPNYFMVGMKLEAIDPENCSLFCVCTVVSIMGYRLKLSFDGYGSAYDFWLNADSMDIFPPGWCTKTNRILQPPKGITANKFNWGAYLNKEKAFPAPRHLFTHLNSSSLVPHNPFKVGMHLEAEDLNDTGKLCVASVADVLDDRIRIHFDGWDDCYDIIVDINSPYIHPCGWHDGRQQLVVPPDCENTAFNWNEYICKQGTGEAACEELFAPREPICFKPNMRLEVVDPRNPSLIRPATVIAHKGHRVKLHLDGWPSDYCFWLEDDSPDLHPIGWCDATGHDLEPPPGFQILNQKMPCPVDGCRGIGNAKNAFKYVHATKDGCPYAAENWRTVIEKPQRVNYDNIIRTLPKQGKHASAQQVASMQSRLSEQQILERLHMLDNIKTRNVLLQQDKLPTNHTDLIGGFSLSQLKKEETKYSKMSNSNSTSTSPSTSSSSSIHQHNSDNTSSSLDVNIEIAREFLYDYGPRLQQNFTLWQKNFSFDAEKIKRNPIKWSATEVSVFVDLYLNCRTTATIFNHEDIDGEAFLLLQQQDLTEKLGIKLGPAVKLYNCILQLRTLAVTKFEVPYKRLLAKK